MKFHTAFILLMMTIQGLDAGAQATSTGKTPLPADMLFIKNNTSQKVTLGFEAESDSEKHLGAMMFYLGKDFDSGLALQGEYEDKSGKSRGRGLKEFILLANKSYPCSFLREEGKLLLHGAVVGADGKVFAPFYLEAKAGGKVRFSSHSQKATGSTPFRITVDQAAKPDFNEDTLLLTIDPLPGK